METMTATELRKEIFNVLQKRSFVEIQHKAGSMILFPKEALSPEDQVKLGCEETCAKWGEHIPNEETLAAYKETDLECFDTPEELIKSLDI